MQNFVNAASLVNNLVANLTVPLVKFLQNLTAGAGINSQTPVFQIVNPILKNIDLAISGLLNATIWSNDTLNFIGNDIYTQIESNATVLQDNLVNINTSLSNFANLLMAIMVPLNEINGNLTNATAKVNAVSPTITKLSDGLKNAEKFVKNIQDIILTAKKNVNITLKSSLSTLNTSFLQLNSTLMPIFKSSITNFTALQVKTGFSLSDLIEDLTYYNATVFEYFNTTFQNFSTTLNATTFNKTGVLYDLIGTKISIIYRDTFLRRRSGAFNCLNGYSGRFTDVINGINNFVSKCLSTEISQYPKTTATVQSFGPLLQNNFNYLYGLVGNCSILNSSTCQSNLEESVTNMTLTMQNEMSALMGVLDYDKILRRYSVCLDVEVMRSSIVAANGLADSFNGCQGENY